jgi:hypothetical protein
MTENDAYQRGYRDGLQALADWADDAAGRCEKQARGLGRLTLDPDLGHFYSGSRAAMHQRQRALGMLATKARRLAKALPIDPEATP